MEWLGLKGTSKIIQFRTLAMGRAGCSRWKPPMLVGSRIPCTAVFFTELREMIIYSESFLIKEHKALQLIKLIKRIELVKNSFIKTFTFL